MTSGTKLIVAGFILAGTTAYMAYLGAAESWQYYLTANECVENQHSLVGKQLRVSGEVAAGTLQRNNSQQVTFALAEADSALPVVYTGAIPDNLAEGIEVVVEGRLETDGTLRANKLLTKCASKYASDKSTKSGNPSKSGGKAETGARQ